MHVLHQCLLLHFTPALCVSLRRMAPNSKSSVSAVSTTSPVEDEKDFAAAALLLVMMSEGTLVGTGRGSLSPRNPPRPVRAAVLFRDAYRRRTHYSHPCCRRCVFWELLLVAVLLLLCVIHVAKQGSSSWSLFGRLLFWRSLL